MSRLKLFIPLFFFFLLAGLFLFTLGREGYDPQDLPSALIDQALPNFNLETIASENKLTEKDVIGEVFLLNVWATWCVSCRAEHTYLNQLAKQGVKIIGVNYKDDKQQAATWLATLGNPYAINLFDVDGKLGLDLGVYGAPESFLIDKKGIIRYKHVGVVDTNVWQEKIKHIYDELQTQ